MLKELQSADADVRGECEVAAVRDYFAWPNSFFAEMLEKLMVEGKLTKSILSLPRHQCGKKKPPQLTASSALQ